MLALGADDGTASIWSSSGGRDALILYGHTRNVMDVRFSPSGKWLVSGSVDGSARIWEVYPNSTAVIRHAHHGPAVLAMSRRGDHILTGGSDDKQARRWPLIGKPSSADLSHESAVTAVALSSDGKRAFTGTSGGDIFAWDLTNPQQPTKMLLSSGQGVINFASLALSPDETLLAATGTAGQVVTCEVQADSGCKTLSPQMPGWGTSVAFSTDGQLLGSTSNDRSGTKGIGFLWDLSSRKLVRELTGHERPVSLICFANHSPRAATVSWDGTARIWNTTNGNLLATLKGHEGRVTAVRFSQNDSLVATASYDKTVRLWQIGDLVDLPRHMK